MRCRSAPEHSGRLKGNGSGLRERSVLNPRQVVEAPAVVTTTLLKLVQLAFETFQDIECITKASLRKCLSGRHRPRATPAQKEQHVVATHLGFEFAYEPWVAL